MQNSAERNLKSRLSELKSKYESYKAMNLSLDMSRGKPDSEQLALSEDIFEYKYIGSFQSKSGIDCRNYGLLDGIDECKSIFSEILEVEKKNLIIFGNSSLSVMYDYISQCMIFGAGSTPWSKLDKVKFICPVPGYDRHFGICQHFGIEMINVPMLENGPDMDMIEELVKDESVKGVFCVPKYSNPDGVTFSDETVRRFAALRPAASDFRVIWDNAYCVHHLYEDRQDKLLNIFEACDEFGTHDHFIEVISTSKITFPGSGVAALAASDSNIDTIKKRMTVQTIGHDKINMLRHALYFKDAEGIRKHMKLHADILRPKFRAVLDAFEKNLAGKGIASWTNPNGGYFISLDVSEGCAKKIVKLCSDAGVTLTGAGATFPYGIDPLDRNIRIAPTYPPIKELELAVEILCVCIEMACIEKVLLAKAA